MKKTDRVRRRGLVSGIKRRIKKTARKILVRRWLFVAIVKIAAWLVRRLWFDKNRSDLSP